MCIRDSANTVPAILALAFIIFMFSNFQCYEYQQHHNQIIYTTNKGRYQLLHIKLFISLLCGFLFTLFAFTFDLYQIYEVYGLSNIHASITSLHYFSYLPSQISILQFMIITWCLKPVSYTHLFCFF